uniref:G-protein coupled receptors family 1 profile domain-containing protein n=1 Tax=Ornithorhynchus anatinus TaxID=9258 RepID=A0A6I8NZI5_ORNAN
MIRKGIFEWYQLVRMNGSNNWSNTPSRENETSSSITTYVCITIVFSVGLVFNVFALWVFCYKMKKWTETRIFVINLAAADLCLIFSGPILLYSMKESNQQEDNAWCRTSQSIYLINKQMSIYIVTLIAVDRYFAIKYPLKAKIFRSPLKAAITCGVFWILVIVSVILLLISSKLYKSNFCFGKRRMRDIRLRVFSLLIFFIPLLILTFCSIQVISSLIKKKKMEAREETLIQKAVYIVSANLIIFLICFLPQHILLLVQLWDKQNVFLERSNLGILLTTSYQLAYINCCLDAVGYYFVAKEFQEASGLIRFTQRRLETDIKSSCTVHRTVHLTLTD